MNTKNNKYKKRKFVKEDDDNDTIRKYTRNEWRTFFFIFPSLLARWNCGIATKKMLNDQNMKRKKKKKKKEKQYKKQITANSTEIAASYRTQLNIRYNVDAVMFHYK